jgi:hypothetical protein
MPSPSWRYDHGYVKGIVGTVGAVTGLSASGEEQQLDFVGTGTVLLQSSEMPLWGRTGVEQVLQALPGLDRSEISRIMMTAQQLLGGNR